MSQSLCHLKEADPLRQFQMAEDNKIYPPPTVTTPRLAPWDHVEALCNKLDRLIALIEAWAPTAPPTAPPPAPPVEWPGWEPVISKLDEIKRQLAEITITTPWVAKAAEEIYRESIRTAGTYYTYRMVDWNRGKRLLLRAESSLDQSVQIQPLGNINNSVLGSTDINAALTCAANGKISVGFAWDDWHPYVGAKIIVATAPTKGILTIEAVIQE